MGKKKKVAKPILELVDTNEKLQVDTGRGKVKDNALKAVVTSQLFRTRVVKAKKGKGSFARKAKYRGKEPYSNAA